MKLIVGLGNPGRSYEQTRHNAGFMIIDALAQRLGADDWQSESKFQAEVTMGNLNGEKLLLIKPTTFMNLSGSAVSKLMHYYKLTPNEMWVVHDDIDLAPGDIQIKSGGGAGGQKGVESIIQYISPEFHRLRFGIGQNDRAVHAAEDYVMMPLETSETQIQQAVDVLIKNLT